MPRYELDITLYDGYYEATWFIWGLEEPRLALIALLTYIDALYAI
jgi:hypothetical protein